MDTIKLWARNGDAVRQAIELGDIVHMHTASEELTDEFLLFAISSGLLKGWADAFPDPRQEAEIGMNVILAAAVAARFGLLCVSQAGLCVAVGPSIGRSGLQCGGHRSRQRDVAARHG